jgi:hypothetical protein
MATPPSRERLAVAIGALSTDAIRTKLQSGELTEDGRSVAEAELARREGEGELLSAPARTTAPTDLEVFRDFLARPLGWSWARWIVLIAACFLLVRSFGATPQNKGDEGFLLGVIGLQAVALAGIVRTVVAVFSRSSALRLLGKLAAIVVLGYVLFGLTVCSQMAQHGWLGG